MTKLLKLVLLPTLTVYPFMDGKLRRTRF